MVELKMEELVRDARATTGEAIVRPCSRIGPTSEEQHYVMHWEPAEGRAAPQASGRELQDEDAVLAEIVSLNGTKSNRFIP